jgi:hypothetical protein
MRTALGLAPQLDADRLVPSPQHRVLFLDKLLGESDRTIDDYDGVLLSQSFERCRECYLAAFFKDATVKQLELLGFIEHRPRVFGEQPDEVKAEGTSNRFAQCSNLELGSRFGVGNLEHTGRGSSR